MLLFIVTLGNMLGNVFATLKNHWELKKTPCKHHNNLLGMCWEHFMNTKTSKNQNCLEINIQTIPTLSQSQLKLEATSYKNYGGATLGNKSKLTQS
jgi:hypothetical protein